jgi:hypothetical protein
MKLFKLTGQFEMTAVFSYNKTFLTLTVVPSQQQKKTIYMNPVGRVAQSA